MAGIATAQRREDWQYQWPVKLCGLSLAQFNLNHGSRVSNTIAQAREWQAKEESLGPGRLIQVPLIAGAVRMRKRVPLEYIRGGATGWRDHGEKGVL